MEENNTGTHTPTHKTPHRSARIKPGPSGFFGFVLFFTIITFFFASPEKQRRRVFLGSKAWPTSAAAMPRGSVSSPGDEKHQPPARRLPASPQCPSGTHPGVRLAILLEASGNPWWVCPKSVCPPGPGSLSYVGGNAPMQVVVSYPFPKPWISFEEPRPPAGLL